MHFATQVGIAKLILMLSLLAGCASGPTIRSNVDEGVDLTKYKTFGFFDKVAGRQPYERFAAQYLRDAITRELQARGYQLADNPELLVNFHVQQKDKVDVTSTPAYSGYYGYRAGAYGWGTGMSTTVDQYTEGTLNIDLVDRNQSRLVWEGIAVGRIRERARQNIQPVVDEVVKQIFERFPVKKPLADGS